MPRRDPTTLSVATPAKEAAAFLPDCIASVRDGAEHWVVDAASTDGTLDILRAARGVRWVSEPDRGQADGVNKGWRLSSGDILGWVNADDALEDGAVPAVRSFFAEHPEADAVYGDAVFVDESNRTVAPYPAEKWRPSRLRRICFIPQPAMFLRRRVPERFGFLDEGLHHAMDYDYWLRLAGHADVRYLPQVLARFRLHPGMKTIARRREAHEEIVNVLETRTGRVDAGWILGLASARADEEVERGALEGTPCPYLERVLSEVRRESMRRSVRRRWWLRAGTLIWRRRARRGEWPFRPRFPYPAALAGRVFWGRRM
ncbi:MAG: glycosyltransferase family 2 protein [Planctomycetota bacterium]